MLPVLATILRANPEEKGTRLHRVTHAVACIHITPHDLDGDRVLAILPNRLDHLYVVLWLDRRMNRIAGHADKPSTSRSLPYACLHFLAHLFQGAPGKGIGAVDIPQQANPVAILLLRHPDVHSCRWVNGMDTMDASIHNQVKDGPDVSICVL